MDPNSNIIRIHLPSDKGNTQIKTRATTLKNKNRLHAKLATHTLKRPDTRIETPAEQVLERRSAEPPKESVIAPIVDSYHVPSVSQTGYAETPGMPNCIPTIGLDGKVKWGCLKNGTLPTYRTLRNKLSTPLDIAQQPPPPPTYSVVDYSISPTPIRNLDIPVHPLTTADLLAKHRAEKALITPKPIVHLQKRTIRRTRSSGMSKDKKEVLVQLSSKPLDVSSCPIPSMTDMKRYLVRRKLIDPASSAPIDMIRELYQTSISSDDK